MTTVTLEKVKGRDLAERLARELKLDPERTYTVTVHTEDAELAAADSLEQVMDIVAARAKERGLDARGLDALLKER